MITYIKSLSPEQKRKVLYAAATVACVVYATWEAHNRDWRATGIALVTAAITKLAHANVNDPTAVASQQPIFQITSAMVGPDAALDDAPASPATPEAPAQVNVTLADVNDQLKALNAALTGPKSTARTTTRRKPTV